MESVSDFFWIENIKKGFLSSLLSVSLLFYKEVYIEKKEFISCEKLSLCRLREVEKKKV